MLVTPQRRTISAAEPLIVQVRIDSRCRDDLRLLMGNSTASALYLRVYDATGRVVAATPRRGGTAGGLTSFSTLPAGESLAQTWVVSALYQFRTPCEYELHMQLEGQGAGNATVAETRTSIRVEPFNAQRLDGRLAELIAPCRDHSALGGFDVGCRSKALYSVRDDVALPYLDWMAREWSSRYACRAIRRIGTPRAKALYEALAARTDSVGKAARSVPQLNMPDVAMWDIICD